MSYVAERNGEKNVAYVRPRPALPEVGGDWRKTNVARQARARPKPGAPRIAVATYPVEDGLRFGSAEELRVYRALKRLQSRFPEHDTIAIAPLPAVRLRAGHTWEPDILVMGRGHVLIIETDGPHHRSTRRYADDRNRDLQWQRCGVPVVRGAVEDLRDDKRAYRPPQRRGSPSPAPRQLAQTLRAARTAPRLAEKRGASGWRIAASWEDE